jgi:hypothetical protein
MIEGRLPISWSSIQALHEPGLERHWVRCRDELGLDCPLEVFEELFFEHHGVEDFGTMYRTADSGHRRGDREWLRVRGAGWLHAARQSARAAR